LLLIYTLCIHLGNQEKQRLNDVKRFRGDEKMKRRGVAMLHLIMKRTVMMIRKDVGKDKGWFMKTLQ
jgi:hypothetical protein